MKRLNLSSSALVVGIVAVAMSCGGNVVVDDASGTASGAGAGPSGSGAGAGSGSGAGNGSGAGAGSGVGGGLGLGAGGAGTGAATSGGGASTSGTSGAVASSSSSGTTSGVGGSTALDPCGGGPGSLGWIDDMNNGLGRIDPTDGRKGSWYTANDGTAGGTQTPAAQSVFTMTPIPANAPAPLPGYTMAANTSGSGFDDWGAFMGFDLDNDGITYAAYDASTFHGVCLWARVGPKADSGGQTIRMRILDATTTPQGGICDGNATSGPTQCYDGFGANMALTSEWQVFKYPWGSLQQQGWGESAPAITTDKLYSVDFETGAADAFDTWVFGIEFF